MNYRRLGRAGVKVSELSLGSWVTFGDQISDDVAEDLMIKAYEGGINFFDNAEGYAAGECWAASFWMRRRWSWSAAGVMRIIVYRLKQLSPPLRNGSRGICRRDRRSEMSQTQRLALLDHSSWMV